MSGDLRSVGTLHGPGPAIIDAWLDLPGARDQLFNTEEDFARAEQQLREGKIVGQAELRHILGRLAGREPPAGAANAIAELDTKSREMLSPGQLLHKIAPHPQHLGELMFGLDQPDDRMRLRAAVARAYRVATRYAGQVAARRQAVKVVREEAPLVRQLLAELRPRLEQLRINQRDWRDVTERSGAARADRIKSAITTLIEEVGGTLEWIAALSPRDFEDEDEGDVEIADSQDWSYAWEESPDSAADATSMIAALDHSRERLQMNDTDGDWRRIEDRYDTRRALLERERRQWEWHEFQETAAFPGKAHRPDRFLLLRLGEIYSVSFGLPATWYVNNPPGIKDAAFAEFVDIVLRSCAWPEPAQRPARKWKKAPYAGGSLPNASSGLLITDDALRGVAKGFPPAEALERMEFLASTAVAPLDDAHPCISYPALLSNALLIDMNAWRDDEL